MSTATKNPSNIPGWTSRHCDGQPGLEYFTDGTAFAWTAFAWTGSLADPIEISPSGHGEPVEYLLDLSNLLITPRQPLDDTLAWFAATCDEWLTWAESYDYPLPVRAELDRATSASRQHYIETGVYFVQTAESQ